jgi:CheY-like chemotaxis protein
MRGRNASTVMIVSRMHPESDPDLNTAFLEQSNIRLVSSPRGDGALGLARAEHPDLIIEDIGTDAVEPLGLFRQLRSAAETRDIPLILVAEGNQARAAKPGPAVVLEKPLIPNEFYQVVRRYVPLPDRRHLRYAINLRFTFDYGGQLFQAFSRDISLNGAFLKTDRLLPPDARLRLSFHLPGDGVRIHCGGVVRRVSEAEARHRHVSGLGVEFLGILDSDLGLLEGFLLRHLKREPLFR